MSLRASSPVLGVHGPIEAIQTQSTGTFFVALRGAKPGERPAIAVPLTGREISCPAQGRICARRMAVLPQHAKTPVNVVLPRLVGCGPVECGGSHEDFIALQNSPIAQSRHPFSGVCRVCGPAFGACCSGLPVAIHSGHAGPEQDLAAVACGHRLATRQTRQRCDRHRAHQQSLTGPSKAYPCGSGNLGHHRSRGRRTSLRFIPSRRKVTRKLFEGGNFN